MVNPSQTGTWVLTKKVVNVLVVGLTGGIGSGKTTVSDWFASQGIDIIDADVLAKEVVKPGAAALESIRSIFGQWVIMPNGQLDRTKLRKHIFNHPDAREALENITHPAIQQAAKTALKKANSKYAIVSAPLLLESTKAKLKQLCHRILVVDVDEQTQLNRASQRDGQDVNAIQKIIDTQMPRAVRIKQADDVVDNTDDLSSLYRQLDILHTKYLSLATAYNR